MTKNKRTCYTKN